MELRYILDKVRNTRIIEEMEMDIDITETTDVEALEWFDHLNSMSDARCLSDFKDFGI